MFWFDIAYAQATKPAQPSMLEVLIMPVALIAIFYFLAIRPQQKKHKEHVQLLEGLKVGDEVVTSGGIIGRIKAIADSFVTLEVGANTSFKIQKTHISSASKPAVKADAK